MDITDNADHHVDVFYKSDQQFMADKSFKVQTRMQLR